MDQDRLILRQHELVTIAAYHPEYAAKPRLGIRVDRPNQIWHVDTTIVRFLDGSRAYLYAVIDNFSRKILAWRVSERFTPPEERSGKIG